MTSNAPRASMEGMTMKAKEISECSDIMPKSLKEHQSKIENACLDMIYLFEQALPALLKEAEERVIRHLEEDRWTHHKLDHSFRSEFNIQEDLESEINRLCMQSHNGMVDQAIKITKASLTEPSK